MKENGYSSKRMAWSIVLSLGLNLGMVAWAGGFLENKPNPSTRLEVDLMLLAPPAPEPEKAAPAPLPPQPEPTPPEPKKEKPQPRPKPVKKNRPAVKRKPPEKPKPKAEPVPAPDAPAPPSSVADASAKPSPGKKALGEPRPVSKSCISGYAGKIHSRIARAKRYPHSARAAGEEGTVKVKFTVGPTGSVSGIRVAKSSGFASLDQAAIDAVSRAAPFPPLPACVGRDSLTLRLSVSFHLN